LACCPPQRYLGAETSLIVLEIGSRAVTTGIAGKKGALWEEWWIAKCVETIQPLVSEYCRLAEAAIARSSLMETATPKETDGPT
jgi:hypothetical protein